MKLLMLVPILLLSACATSVPVTAKFPEVPKELLNSCPDLKQTEPTKKLSDVAKVVVENYGQYYECKVKSETWIEWYNSQKQIFMSVH
jgi:hypothetical protein